ncbi:spermatogenesis-associated protein 7 [Triplophysa rosa]|uniref:spermatogenesis-associated protein 7 n=1 Tax=Triplophysa rosa TaxID=992332 RepID=UPI002545DDB5|nr:spermatogenesis-associated protein 7 [Triplophysa rosa]
MGVLTEFLTMDTKPGYCHGSSGKRMNQYMIKDHMLSHYRKLYSAKAAVDCSVPKSMQCNVKYVDRKRREQLKKDLPSRSGRSESQRSTRFNSRASCSSKNSGASVHGDNTLDHSVMSSPRISTSFHSKQIVYPSQIVLANHFRSSSELHGYRSPNLVSGHLSSVGQRQYKTFQDPTQKTYSGDVLLKHAHRFTQEKLFTPRTLKSNHKSTLVQYRYYTPPKRKDEQKRSPSFQMTRQESSQSKRGFSPQLDSPQAFSVVHEWSDEESDSFRRHRTADFLLSSSRVSPEGMKSPIMRKVTEEEEELMYLEFMTDVTNEILAQGLYSDRVLKRVFERHIDMNRHRLDENKMRHLLDNLHNDLQKPSEVSVSFLSIHESDKPSKLRQELSSVIRDDAGFISHAVFDEVRGQRENITSTPVNDSLLESSSSLHMEKVEKEPELNLEINPDAGCEMSLNDNEHVTGPEEHLRNTTRDHGLLEQVDEIGKSMRELLKVSESQKNQFKEEEMTDKLSDDEF